MNFVHDHVMIFGSFVLFLRPDMIDIIIITVYNRDVTYRTNRILPKL